MLSAPTETAELVGGMLLPPVPESAKRARSDIAALLKGLDSAYDPSDCMLMLSELVTNAVRHADVEGEWVIHVACWQDGGVLWVEVYDPGAGKPLVQSAGPDDTSGRGLQIVASASESWGSATTPEGGTMVWFCVHLA